MNTTDVAPRTEGAQTTRASTGRPAHRYAFGFWLLSLVLFWHPLTSLAILAFHDERSSHVLIIPLISAFIILLERKKVFYASCYCPSIGATLLLVAALLWYSLETPLSHLSSIDRSSGIASLIVLVWIAGFVLFYGTKAFKAAMFPLLFLSLMIPIPVALADNTVSLLQKASAATCYALFRIMDVPVMRHGFEFSLPGVDIEVAEQCSGIHSALALFISGLLLQHFLLRRLWARAFFTASIFPIAILKNAIRIVTIAWLGIHVSPNFFHGQLHRQGGLPFSVLSMAILGILLWLLRRQAPSPA